MVEERRTGGVGVGVVGGLRGVVSWGISGGGGVVVVVVGGGGGGGGGGGDARCVVDSFPSFSPCPLPLPPHLKALTDPIGWICKSCEDEMVVSKQFYAVKEEVSRLLLLLLLLLLLNYYFCCHSVVDRGCTCPYPRLLHHTLPFGPTTAPPLLGSPLHRYHHPMPKSHRQ